ncbi:hypothetical protein BGW80DRAFT_484718 [Lactifluus volemus]|nr:hypothetical protein BGW80DRAFT_484718 [Lactifluus volemus]
MFICDSAENVLLGVVIGHLECPLFFSVAPLLTGSAFWMRCPYSRGTVNHHHLYWTSFVIPTWPQKATWLNDNEISASDLLGSPMRHRGVREARVELCTQGSALPLSPGYATLFYVYCPWKLHHFEPFLGMLLRHCNSSMFNLTLFVQQSPLIWGSGL